VSNSGQDQLAPSADERGILKLFDDEFPLDLVDSRSLAALTYADLTTSPEGLLVTPRERLEEIRQRYPKDHPVHKGISRATPVALADCDEMWRSLKALSSSSQVLAATPAITESFNCDCR
jgi:hypothetical protein